MVFIADNYSSLRESPIRGWVSFTFRPIIQAT